MTYSVKEIFYTLQGEGANAGRAAVFCRFAGCNLWSGRETDRGNAVCRFCDTDFVGCDGLNGGKFSSAMELALEVDRQWMPAGTSEKFVVFTGGEPLLQLDEELVGEVKRLGFWVAIETNGTLPVPRSIDWVCVSPKAGAQLVALRGSELKLVYPQANLDPWELEKLSFDYYYLQPMDGPNRATNTTKAIEYCLRNPRWRLSVQMHKTVGIN